MTIEVIKSKITHIKVTTSHINCEGVIKMSKALMEESHIRVNERVFIINESLRSDGSMKTAFVEEFEMDSHYPSNAITTPVSISGPNDEITIISMARIPVDTISSNPILINMSETND